MTLESFEIITDVLLDAYNENKLFHGDCSACAVGNICKGNDDWINHVPITRKGATIFMGLMTDRPMPETVAPVSKGELRQIECAFEMAIVNTKEGYYYYATRDASKLINFSQIHPYRS